jgi:hypothetical protein
VPIKPINKQKAITRGDFQGIFLKFLISGIRLDKGLYHPHKTGERLKKMHIVSPFSAYEVS